ncbi:MAG: hypothetical protein JRD89_13205 [Deltaproteobacteria bacterium]|nr:hypothetical protein [Deltaproteobacteria bacterium]
MSWEEIGRIYMRKAREAEPWKGIMYGIAHTHLMRIDYDKKAVDRMLETAPSPNEAKRRCPISPNVFRGLGFYRTDTVSKTICDKAEHSDKFISAVRRCARDELKAMKLEGVDMYGLGWKGADMTLLDCGCETPVIDVHLARYLARTDPEFLRELGLKEYDPEAVSRKVRTIQISRNPTRYDRLWRIAKKHAEREGKPAGEWHVEVWMRERFRSEYPRLTEEQRLELARNYVRNLFK